MPALEGGAAMPVTTTGTGITEARPAVPVYVVSGGPVLGQRARRVVVVTSGPMEGGAAIPVYDTGADAATDGDAALPVYIVSGPNLYPQAYTSKVKAIAPANLIAFWPMAETSGTTIVDESGNGRNGTYSNVTLGAAGMGDGRTAVSFNGTTSVGNVYSASLAAAFNGQEGSFSQWCRVSGAGVWTDGLIRRSLYFLSDSSNRVGMLKPVANNEIDCLYVAGGTAEGAGKTSFSPTGWFHLGLTWSKTADQMIFYVNGVAITPVSTGLGTFAGALSTTQTTIGSLSSAPAQVWSGDLGRVAVWTTPLSAAQMAALAVP